MHAAGPSPWPTTSPAVLPSAIPDHELLCLIGRGAYGEVWMARNAIGTLRAVKIVHRQSFQRVEHFEREFKGLLKFEPISRSHDGLVDILQIGRRDDAGYFFYVMELADAAAPQGEYGGSNLADSEHREPATDRRPSSILHPLSYSPRTLRSELHHRGSLPSAECVSVGLKLASALQHLHSNGLVHRDIKPSNIIFVKGEPKLADIGLVTAIDDAHSLVGTAGYIPPEGPGTPQADLYGLGKVLYEIAFGKGRQDFPQLPADLQSRPDYAALLELNEVILKSCETNPSRRYASAADLGQDLALLQKGRSVKQSRTQEKRRAIAKKCILVGVAVASLMAALLFFQSVGREYKPTPEAARLYEDGCWYYSQLTSEDHAKAFTNLTLATQKDPKFLKPYGELTMLHVWRMFDGLSNEETLRRTREIADKVRAIDPQAAEGHLARSWCHFLNRDWQRAEEEIVLAIKLNPKLAIAYSVYCFYLSMQGKTVEAQRIGQMANELEPPSSRRVTAIVAAWPFIASRHFDLAVEQLRRCMDLDSKFLLGHHYLARCYEAQSNYPSAIEEFKTFELSTGRDKAKVEKQYALIRQAYDTQGQRGYFRQWIEKIHSDEADDEPVFMQTAAGYHALLGEKEEALHELEAEFETFGVWQVLKFDARYDPLYDEPRFKELVKRAGLSE